VRQFVVRQLARKALGCGERLECDPAHRFQFVARMTMDHHERAIRESESGGTEHQSVRFAAKARRRIGTIIALRPCVAATGQPDGTIGR
jgi:hypothetical protein